MADDVGSKIPAWLKSLYEMENELRDAARNSIILRSEKASEHLAAARKCRHNISTSTWRNSAAATTCASSRCRMG